MIKKIVPYAAFFLLVFVLFSLAAIAEQHLLSEKLIRLHVIANSDSQSDQALKLEVRDAVLHAFDERPGDLVAAQDAATRIVRDRGLNYPVAVEYRRETYPVRYYDGFALPAGEYNSVRCIIGEGEGQNWWCVLFPPLCFSAAEDFGQVASDAGLTAAEIEYIDNQEGDLEIRFKFLEVFRSLCSLFSGA